MPAMTGTRDSRRRAGMSVILRSASISDSDFASRTYRPRTFEYVPAVRGWPMPSVMYPSLAIAVSGLLIAAATIASVF